MYFLVRFEGDYLFLVVTSKSGCCIDVTLFSTWSFVCLLERYFSNLASYASNLVFPLPPNFGGSNRAYLRTPLALLLPPELRPRDRDFSERLFAPLKAEFDRLAGLAFVRADLSGREPTLFEPGSSKATLAFRERLRVGGVSFSSLS